MTPTKRTLKQRIVAVDPGPERSAVVSYDHRAKRLRAFGIYDNEPLRAHLMTVSGLAGPHTRLVVEMVASYGMPVGAEVFETCVWIGRFIECWNGPWSLLYRKDVKMALCGNMRAKDSNIRQALIDRFGPGKDKAIGLKATPGPLYGVKKDVWAALGVAVTWAMRGHND